jgi:hypothetical protein
MHLTPGVYRPISSLLFAILVLPNNLSGYPQASAREWKFPNQRNPLIAIWNASSVVINSWDKDEVSIRAEVLTSAIQIDEAKVKADNHRLVVSCSPAKQGRKFLTLHVPSKSVLEISSDVWRLRTDRQFAQGFRSSLYKGCSPKIVRKCDSR